MLQPTVAPTGRDAQFVNGPPIGQATAVDPDHWSLAQRIAFRFAMVFLVCFIFPFPLNSFADEPVVADLREPLVRFVGTRVLHVTPARLVSLELHDAVSILTFLLVAAVATLVWSIADRRHAAYPRLHAWTRLYARFYLASTLLFFGFMKVFPVQFPPPTLARLIQPLGDYDAFSLMWAFMGSSSVYTFFAGAVEVLCGLMLLVSRLVSAGALLSLGALVNVLALDVGYDVHDRTFCAVLIVICSFLLAPDLGRLGDMFVFNRAVRPAPPRLLFRSPRRERVALTIQSVLAVCIVAHHGIVDWNRWHEGETATRRNSLRGIWSANVFAMDGRTLPPLVTDTVRWQRVVIDSPDLLTIQLMNGSLHTLEAAFDSTKTTLDLRQVEGDSSWHAHFAVTNPQADALLLDGSYEGRTLHLELRRTRPRFALNERRFQWPEEPERNPLRP